MNKIETFKLGKTWYDNKQELRVEVKLMDNNSISLLLRYPNPEKDNFISRKTIAIKDVILSVLPQIKNNVLKYNEVREYIQSL